MRLFGFGAPRFVIFTAIWTDLEHPSVQRPSLSIFREQIFLSARALQHLLGQARPTPYEKLTPSRRSLYVQSTVKNTNLELTSITKHQRQWQALNWRKSCLSAPWRYHAVTDHPARHDLSLRQPVAFGEHRMMLRHGDLPRSKSDRGEPQDQSRAEEPCFVPGRIRQSCGASRGLFGSFKKSCASRAPVLLRAFAPGTFPPTSDIRGRAERRTFPVEYSAEAMPDLAHCIERPSTGRSGCNEIGRLGLINSSLQ